MGVKDPAGLPATSLERQLGYWRERLAGLEPLELPTDHPRPAARGERTGCHGLTLGPALAGRLRSLGRQRDATLDQVLLAGLMVLLWRYTGQEDLAVGTPAEPNTLVIRARVCGDDSFERVLEGVRTTSLEARAHPDVPFERLVDELGVTRDPSRAPLFQVLCAVDAPLPEAPAGLDLAVVFGERETGLSVELVYRRDLFEPETAARLAGHLRELLAGIAEVPERAVRELPALTEADRARLLEWNRTDRRHDRRRVQEQVAEQARRRPEAVALVSGDRQVTYGELNRRANRLARHLRALGVSRDEIVGVCGQRSLEMAVGLLGVLKAGAAYLPLDPDQPPERLAYMVEQSGVRVVLAELEHQARVSGLARVETLGLEHAEWSAEDPEWAVAADDLAYVIYTSGSTGEPKGVMLEHRGLSNLVGWHVWEYGVRAEDRGAWLAAVSFDASVWELWPYLASGAGVALGDEGVRRELGELPAWLREHGVTICFLATPLVEALLTEGAERDWGLRALLTGGDRLTVAPAQGSRLRLYNNYGPTEYTVVATASEVRRAAESGRPPPIGKPISNTKAYVLGTWGELVPIGVAGELHLGGDGLARGYVGRPDLTAERFVETRWGRLYRTGDVVRWGLDGELEYLGRQDEQVKVRGYRVELGEIEAALLASGRLREAAVLARERDGGGRRLVAFVVGQEGARLAVDELAVELRRRLPEYMVPSAWVELPELPLTTSGKVDRRRLPEPEPEERDAYEAPADEVEAALAQIWSAVLRVERVGVHDNFFDLGGDSIQGVQVVSRAREAGLQMSQRLLFHHQTVRELARAAAAADEAGGTVEHVPAEPSAEPRMAGADVEDAYPLSPLQKGMLFHALAEPESRVYHQQLCFVLRGPLAAEAFAGAWQRMVDRHGVLRTAVVWEGVREPLQVVRRKAELEVARDDWGSEGESRLAEYLESDRRRGFELTRAPLLRLGLFGRGGEEVQVVLSFHHLLLDGWSVASLLEEVFESYEAGVEGRAERVEERRPYREFIEWLGRQDGERAEAYWRGELSGLEGGTLLRGGSEGGVGQEPGQWRLEVGEELSGRLVELARRGRVTLNTVVQGAWALLLSRYSGEREVVFGATGSGRSGGIRGVERMLGLLINTLPVRVGVEPGAELMCWLRGLQERQWEGRQYEHTPLYEIQKWSGRGGGEALFESLLAFENYPVGDSFERWLSGPLRAIGGTNYPLTLAVVPLERGLDVDMAYDRARFDEADVARIAERLEELLRQMAERPGGRLDEYQLLGEAERERLLRDWGERPAEYPRDACVHDLFEEQAALRGDRTAIVSGDREVGYAELNRRANQLARYLRRRGVGPEERVGLCVGRSVEMVVGILGIFKAGGGYVPLDPGYPDQRLGYLAADAGVRVAVTTERWRARVPAGLCVVSLDAEADEIAAEPEGNLERRTVPENLACVLYTSGSTGEPKGVETTHRCIVRTLRGQTFATLGPDEVVMQSMPMSWDGLIFELWSALLHGGRSVQYGEEVPTPDGIAELVLGRGVTTLCLPTALLNVVADERMEVFRGVRQVLSGGEAASPARLRRLRETWPDLRLVNGYGPVETTVYATVHAVGERVGGGVVPVGRPIGSTRVRVLGSALEVVPAGVVGEVYIGGDGLSRGYLGRPGQTAERFVPDPYGGRGERLYRTGDLARWRPDGELEFVARADGQVKVRGHRVEPEEVERALRAHERVREAAVVTGEDAGGRKRLIGYVVWEAGREWTVRGLREDLRARLPEYLVPGLLVELAELPLTANGKLDRGRLPAPEVRADGEYEQPGNELEADLARIWQEVLGVERVGVEDNFFELGGDSILSIQVVSRAREAGLRLSPRLLFRNQTVRELARVVGEAADVAAEQGPVSGAVPLTPVQRWFFELGLERPDHFNQWLVLDVGAGLAPASLETAIAALEEHHDALRMRFWREDGAWRQENPVAAAPFRLARLDVTGLGERRRSAALTDALDALQRGLDLEAGRLVGGLLIEGGERPRLALVVHHLVVDGVSWRVLLEDLERGCAQAARGQLVDLGPKTTSFRRWALRLAEHAGSAAVEAERPHWEAVCRTAPPGLPVDHRLGENTVGSTDVVDVSFGAEETAALLQRVPAAYRTHVNDALLTGLVRAVSEWAGDPTVLVELEGHGREDVFEDVDVTRTVGWFTTGYPVLLDAAGDEVETLRSVRERLRAVPQNGLGHGLLLHLAPDRDAASRLRHGAQVAFNYLGQWETGDGAGRWLRMDRGAIGLSLAEHEPRQHLLEVVAEVSGGRLLLRWMYSRNLHRRATVEALAERYAAALQRLIERCDVEDSAGWTPSDFPLAGLEQDELDSLAALLEASDG